jgi:hypothetical protein
MAPARRIPLLIKLLYSAFVAVMVPCYWHTYGPQNFLYFCDTALLVTLVGIWRESSLLISMEAVAILLPQMIWIADFVSRLLGFHLIGMTEYMFDPQYSLFLRGLSLFHAWLPILLVWLVDRLGYDRRAVVYQTVVGALALWVCYFAFTPPGTTTSWRLAVNINYVFGTSDAKPQTVMPPLLWLGIMLVGMPLLLYFPTHLVLSWAMPRASARTNGEVTPFCPRM